MDTMTQIQPNLTSSLGFSPKFSINLRERIGFDKLVPDKEKYSIAERNDFINELRIKRNLELIGSFGELEEGWDSYNAEKINDEVILRAKKIIKKLNIQPDIFPTPRGTIQIEYEKDENYLEVEIFSDKFILYYEINGEDESRDYTDIDQIISEINKYAEEIEQGRQYTTI